MNVATAHELRTETPSALSVAFDSNTIPAELRERPQWVAWRPEKRGEKVTKVPVSARTGAPASSTNPATWSTFAEALAFVGRRGTCGVGFVFTEHDPFAGVDLDHCIDPETGVVAEWALSIVRVLDGYSEISPSGTGIKTWVRAKLGKGCKKGDVEMYDRGRYFTVTGRRFDWRAA